MKICPKCNQQYDDSNLNFCLSDGEMLMETQDADATPTVYMDAPRVTNQNWEQPADPMQGQQNPQDQQILQQPFSGPQNYPTVVSQDKTLATVSLVLGILSLVLLCCHLGIPLGAGAAITGYIGMTRANNDPGTYGGGGLATTGLVLGGIGLAIGFVFIFIALLGAITG